MATPLPAQYLLQQEYPDSGEQVLRMFDLVHLTAYLTADIQCSQDGDTSVVKIVRYDSTPAGNGPGELTELHVRQIGGRRSAGVSRYILAESVSGAEIPGTDFAVWFPAGWS
jgi:hypothetical protein